MLSCPLSRVLNNPGPRATSPHPSIGPQTNSPRTPARRPELNPPPLPSPAPPHAQVASQGAEAVMFIFIAGVVLGAVPQYIKLVLLASSDGISLTSLALMNVSNLTATLNIFILHFEQIKMCVQYQPGFTFDSCQARPDTYNRDQIHDGGHLFPKNEEHKGIIYDKCTPR